MWLNGVTWWCTAALLIVQGASQSPLCSCNTSSAWAGLALLYEATGGSRWNVSTRWLEPFTTVCDWHGVECSSSGLSLALERNSLSGTLPNELGYLLSAVGVTRIQLRENLLSGTLPPGYGLWGASLQRFDVAANKRLSGAIPVAYAAWTRLEQLYLFNCNITGPLPVELSAWRQLKIFDAFSNQFNGTLPRAALRNWTLMGVFNVAHNSLTGTVPISDMANWTVLEVLHLGDNHFTGEFFSELLRGVWPSLLSLGVGSNKLSGTIPPFLKQWALLVAFNVGRNLLEGTLPSELQHWTQMQKFDVSANRLGGALPVAYSVWDNMCAFEAADNRFSGTLPASYSAWKCHSKVIDENPEFNVSSNLLSGVLPKEYKAWSFFAVVDISSNQLNGTLPLEYSEWGAAVEHFKCKGNLLAGTLPEQLANWTNLKIFDIASNHFDGTLPAAYAAWRKLQSFFVAHNFFDSSLPSDYGSGWPELRSCSVAHNRLQGAIPLSYTLFFKLQVLLLNDNNFIGAVPPLVVSLALTLHNSRGISGPLPIGISPTAVVSVCNTSLCGNMPVQWFLTKFICQEISDAEISLGVLVLHEVSPVLPSCSSVPSPTPKASSATTAPRALPRLAEGKLADPPAQALATVALVVGAPVGGGVMLQVAFRVARLSPRLRACESLTNTEQGASASELGASVADSPTQLCLPGRLPLTAGAVVGNTLLVAGVPPLVTAIAAAAVSVRGASVSSTALLLRVGVAAFVAAWGMLQVPLTAAAVTLLIDARWHGDAVSSAVGAIGLVVSLLPVATIRLAYTKSRVVAAVHNRRRAFPAARRCRKNRLAGVGGRRFGELLKVAAVWLQTVRSTWDTQRLSAACHTLSLPAVVSTLAVQLLRDLHAPHRWAMLSDQAVGLLQGVLVGVASSAETSCGALRAVMWCLFAVCAATAVVAVGARPRATHNDCAFQAVMACWTAAVALMSATGYDDGADNVAVSQSIVQLVWCVPVVVWRLRIFSHDNSALSPETLPPTRVLCKIRRSDASRQLPGCGSVLGVSSFEKHSVQAVLSKLVMHVCREQRQRSKDAHCVT